MDGMPSQGAILIGVLACLEAIADVLIARDPAIRLALTERLEERIAAVERNSDAPPGSAEPLRVLRDALEAGRSHRAG